MSDDIQFDGVRYVAAAEAGAQVNLSRDYIAKLCREGKVRGRRIGKNWFVEIDSLSNFLGQNAEEKNSRNEKLSEQRKKEYRGVDISHAPEKIFSKPSPKDLDVGLPKRHTEAPKLEQIAAVASNIFPD